MATRPLRDVYVENARLWNGEHLVRVSRVYGHVVDHIADGYAATVRFRGFRGLFVIPVKRLTLV
jgi:hypothetical protein